MKIKKIILLFVLFIAFGAVGQEKFEVKKIGFSIDTPKNWLSMKNEDVLNNLEKYDFTDKQLDELLKSNNSAVNLVTYTKYNPSNYAGIIPTIKIRTRDTDAKNMDDFLKDVESSNEAAKKALENFRFIKSPSTVKISNENVLKFTIQFTLKNGGKAYEIISYSYYVLRNGYYISLNFIEEVGKENNTALFEDMIKSIQLTKS